jgi:hypothetical protein
MTSACRFYSFSNYYYPSYSYYDYYYYYYYYYYCPPDAAMCSAVRPFLRSVSMTSAPASHRLASTSATSSAGTDESARWSMGGSSNATFMPAPAINSSLTMSLVSEAPDLTLTVCHHGSVVEFKNQKNPLLLVIEPVLFAIFYLVNFGGK